MQAAPPPVNPKGLAAVNGNPNDGPKQSEIHQDIQKLVIDAKGNTENSTSRRLAQMAGSLGGHTFKNTVGNENGHANGNGHSGYPTQYVLPPDVDESAFLAFIDDAKRIVGSEHVVVNVSPEHQAQADYDRQPKFYVSPMVTGDVSMFLDNVEIDSQVSASLVHLLQDFFAIQPKDENMSSAVIQPDSAEQVSELVKSANKHKMPISPVSIGRNLGYGGTAPRLRGTATIDMKRMDRILEVNEESAYCLVEPGVSYFNMYEHLQKIGSNLWIDTRELTSPQRNAGDAHARAPASH